MWSTSEETVAVQSISPPIEFFRQLVRCCFVVIVNVIGCCGCALGVRRLRRGRLLLQLLRPNALHQRRRPLAVPQCRDGIKRLLKMDEEGGGGRRPIEKAEVK